MWLETVWFCLVAFMLAGYVVLDGFDLGVGAVHLLVAKTDDERRQVLNAIGPVWDGNEVWLIAGGGTLYFAFPALYATSFSGFYLPLMIVLWLLMFRGLAIELRAHLDSPVWKPLWDVAFALSSGALALILGVALGNVVRGVDMDAHHRFFNPLFTDFGLAGKLGILDWYTVIVGATAFAGLVYHGLLWLSLMTAGSVRARAGRLARRLWPLVALLTVLVTICSFRIQPRLGASFAERPWGGILPAAAAVGLAAAVLFQREGRPGGAFVGSTVYLAAMLGTAAFSLYPAVLPGIDPHTSLTIHNAAAGRYGLRVGLYWWIPGILLAGVYSWFSYTRHVAARPREEAGG